MERDDYFVINDTRVNRGSRQVIELKISELYTASPVVIHVNCIHGVDPGPVLFITAVIHGDELNGIEIIRQLNQQIDPAKLSGTLLLVPIANPIAFVSRTRDLPDGRDLNRSFPGKEKGSMASHIANELFQQIIMKSNYGIDLHTASYGRTNLPHVRANLANSRVRNLAFSFGCEIIIDSVGEDGTLRCCATAKGVPTIVFETGQPMTFDKASIQKGVAGIKNVLSELKMYNFERMSPRLQLVVNEHKWLRSDHGGILILNARPGSLVKKDQEIGYITNPLGSQVHSVKSPCRGLVVSTTTIPTTIPGSAICHICRLDPAKYKILRNLRIS